MAAAAVDRERRRREAAGSGAAARRAERRRCLRVSISTAAPLACARPRYLPARLGRTVSAEAAGPATGHRDGNNREFLGLDCNLLFSFKDVFVRRTM